VEKNKPIMSWPNRSAINIMPSERGKNWNFAVKTWWFYILLSGSNNQFMWSRMYTNYWSMVEIV